jgi:ubiquinone/menaquinone biosynthesis C-methylase UbiE
VPEESSATRANREWWNATSPGYQESHHGELVGDVLWGPSMPPERQLRILGPSVAGKDVLEVCCGGGQSAVYLAKQGARVVGVDFSTAQLEHARAFAASEEVSIRFIESNVEDLSALGDLRFDIAFSAYALGFVEDVRKVFREVSRHLRPGGLFAFSWQSPLYAITATNTLEIVRSYFDRTPIVFREKEGVETDYHRTYGDWHRALRDAGFVVQDILEPEPLPQENTYQDGFPLAKIRMIPATTIWRATTPTKALPVPPWGDPPQVDRP